MALLDSSAWFWSGLLLFPLVYPYLRQRKDRRKKITPTNERVLILGASSGIGRSIAHLYAARGARLALVARREQALDAVLEECQGPFRNAHVGVDETPPRDGLLRIVADYGNADDMIRVRATIEQRACLFVLFIAARILLLGA
ncbi:hypothetical protein SISSUDRAFT_845407 [Sistotremastrum suecicum HHB10207 ss-3]|uniref:NAD(P)-binding protein n=1 Tax=Sistotremastrum suecicum HHB10207 ss-3 TaxID=1314776 RepID=A0A166HJ37_9AGAM|nr:hypothetical protein SISSUDRAFT_845407 [Sistotremastrum suecicum HHB10207 ss-3]